jgi:hypothetical protein
MAPSSDLLGMNAVIPRRSCRRAGRALATAVLLVFAGCGGSSSRQTPSGLSVGQVAPDFALPDVNPASVTFATDVAPSQYVGSASAWYFGHAT